ncbi:VOC family protein [Fulvivirgaceae bacterium BMA10]|uniref:VOC family protein n=1 Tax=Splendidivirga corallicola TaxID=3051826 RepID=A0ABT8KTB1_9BACT|nr:VOC family protein [Fulvivirgaceae bacterium BMA10]
MTTINPYLTFNGTCEEAFNFYKSVFGGEFQYVGRFKDMPENPEYAVPESDKEKIMHISLPISQETVLMGSDSSEAFGKVSVEGNNFSISINTDTVDETTRIFNGLSEGGKVTMPLNKTFWGAFFGMFTDRFGIHWMISCELKEDETGHS